MQQISQVRSFLLTNNSWGQTLAKNTIWAGVADGTVRLLKMVTVMLMVRLLGPTEYGAFAFAFAFATMFGIVFDAGVLVVATREFAINRANEEFLSDFLMLKLLLGAFGLLALVAGLLWITDDSTTWGIIFVLGLYLFVNELSSLGAAICRARQKMEYETAIRVAQAASLFGGVGLVLWLAPSALNVSYAHLAAAVISLGLVWAAFRQRQWRLTVRLRWDVLWRLFRAALPLGLAGVISSFRITSS